MRRALLGGAVALGTTILISPAVRRLLIRRGSLDIPNHRSSHRAPVPRGGGIACAAGVALGLAAVGRPSGIKPRSLVGVSALTFIGLADDRLGHVDPKIRLGVQAAAGALFGPKSPTMTPLSCVGTAGVVNVVNFMDGINGITGGTAAVWGANALLAGRSRRDAGLQTIGAVTAGAGLGFLPWNVPTAKYFLGDVGSYLFGGLMSAGIGHAAASGPHLAWRIGAPLLPYAFDAAQALVRRNRRGEPLTEAHREHVYQELVDEYHLSHSSVALMHAAAASLAAMAAGSRYDSIRAVGPVACALAYVSLPQVAHQARSVRR